ncbi:MAG: hypothetical protein ACOCUK_00325 [bacterium]
MKKFRAFIAMTIFLLAGGFISCENNEGDMSSEDTAILQDDALSAELFEDIFNETDLILEEQFKELKGETEDTCKTITMKEMDSKARKITINYEDGSCEDFHERVRNGKVVVETSGRYRNKGFTRTLRFEDYHVNDYKVEGTTTIINKGENERGNVTYSIKLENGRIITPDGREITQEYNKTLEWIKGYETPLYKWDNEYLITGSASGTNRYGVNYTMTINEPLHTSATCRFILSGTAEFEKTDKPLILIDYGDENCDATATATVNGTTKEIRLKR